MTTLSHSFSAANTVHGFFSLFSKKFHPDHFRRLFLLKGGPGCGKSTFLKACAATAAHAGYTLEIIHCSADPSSLDGIILPDQKIGLLDATAPHTRDPAYPGVVDTVLNFCPFFDCDALSLIRPVFRELNDKKAACYEAAYNYLSAIGNLRKRRDVILSRIYNTEKAYHAVKRQLRDFQHTDFKQHQGWISAFCADGFVTLQSPLCEGGKTVIIGDAFDTAHLYIDLVARECRAKGLDCVLLRDPLQPDSYEGVCITGSLFLMRGEDNRNHPFVSEKRFLLKQEFSPDDRKELHTLRKLEQSLLYEATEQFSKARQYHMQIESLYAPHIDFEAKEDFTNDFLHNIFLPLLKL